MLFHVTMEWEPEQYPEIIKIAKKYYDELKTGKRREDGTKGVTKLIGRWIVLGGTKIYQLIEADSAESIWKHYAIGLSTRRLKIEPVQPYAEAQEILEPYFT